MNAVRVFVIAGLALLLVGSAAEGRERWLRFTATAYVRNGETASAKPTVEGRTVSADPAVLPLRTKIQVWGPGAYSGVYVVDDRGGKVKGRVIDIFVENATEAKRVGQKKVRARMVQAPQETAEMK